MPTRLKREPKLGVSPSIDRTVLKELANQTTTGERAGYGGGGVTALQAVIATAIEN